MAGDALVHLEVERLDNEQWSELVQLVRRVATVDGRAEIRPEVIVVTGAEGTPTIRAEDVMVGVFGPQSVRSLCKFVEVLGDDCGEVRLHAQEIAFDVLLGVLDIQQRCVQVDGVGSDFQIRPGRIAWKPGEPTAIVEHFEVVLDGPAVTHAAEVLALFEAHARGMEP